MSQLDPKMIKSEKIKPENCPEMLKEKRDPRNRFPEKAFDSIV